MFSSYEKIVVGKEDEGTEEWIIWPQKTNQNRFRRG